MATARLLKRGVEELMCPALSNGQSAGGQAPVNQPDGIAWQFTLSMEYMGCRITFQTLFTGNPTSASVPILGSADGVNFAPVPILTLSNPQGEIQTILVAGIKAIKVGTVTLGGGVSPTVQVTVREQ